MEYVERPVFRCFYLKIKLYLWDPSWQFSAAAAGHFQSRKDLYRLSSGPNDSQDPCWKPVTHTSVFVPTLVGTSPVRTPVQLFSFHPTTCEAEGKRSATGQRSSDIGTCFSNHITGHVDEEVWTSEKCSNPDVWMNFRTCHKSLVSSHHQSVICCTCFS